MPLPALLFVLAAAAPAASEPPVVVRGRPWAPFISPMGEPFRSGSTGEDTLAKWFHEADRNHDGLLTSDEMQADAERFFSKLDADHDGVIRPDELAEYEWEVAPEIQVGTRWRKSGAAAPSARTSSPEPSHGNGRRRGDRLLDDPQSSDGLEYGLQGAARYALLNIPEPVAAADTNLDRVVTLAEFKQAAIDRFQLLDRNHKGQLGFQDLEAYRPPAFSPNRRARRKASSPDARVGVPLPPGD